MDVPVSPLTRILALSFAVPLADIAALPWWAQRLMVDVLRAE